MADYEQTHVVPTEGLAAWTAPDGTVAPAASLDPGLDVMVIETRNDWAHIRCSNGWEAWVDHRRLVVARPAPAAIVTPPPPPQAAAAPTQSASTHPAPAQPQPTAAAAPPPSPQAAPSPTQPTPQATPSTQSVPPTAPAQPGPPSAVWGAPAGKAGAAPAARGFRLGPGLILAMIGGLLFLISSWLPWIEYKFAVGGRSATESFSAYRIPAHFLLDSNSELGGLNFGIVVAFFAVVCIAAALISALNRSLRFLSLVAGVLVFLIVVLFLVQTKYLSNALPSFVDRGYFSLLRWGAYVGLAGAILALVGGVLALAQKRS